MGPIAHIRHVALAALLALLAQVAQAASIDRFVGVYEGEAEIVRDGEPVKRDMSVEIEPTKDGFSLGWTSTTTRSDGQIKTKHYEIEFVPSGRENIFQAAMKTNLFGKATPLDPLKGEPFVWARIEEDTFSVYSLFINETGEYEIQEFHRTLVAEGLDLSFRLNRSGAPEREISTLLKRVE